MGRPINEILDELKEALVENTEQRQEAPTRVISRLAKNVQIGMLVEFPHVGWKEVNGLTICSDQTLLSDGGAVFWATDSNRRVRTKIT